MLKEIVEHKLKQMNIEIFYKHEVDKISRESDFLTISFLNNNKKLKTNVVYNCTYAQINQILMRSGLNLLPLEYELTEMLILRVPRTLRSMAITVVDGPFFSLMPYPSENLHTLSHVLHTKHYNWDDSNNILGERIIPESNCKCMIQDSAKYIPDLLLSDYVKSIYEIKTRGVSLKNQKVPFIASHEIDGLYSVLGGKMDNVFELSNLFNLLDHKKMIKGWNSNVKFVRPTSKNANSKPKLN